GKANATETARVPNDMQRLLDAPGQREQLKAASARLLCGAVTRRSQHNAWNEVYALILLGTGTLLFLALISYVPKDIPTWFPLLNSTSSPNRPAQNFLGPLGAIGAGICYFLIGAASYLLAAALLGFGGAKLFHSELKVSRRLGWIVLFIASGACLLHLQPWFLHDWRRVFKI